MRGSVIAPAEVDPVTLLHADAIFATVSRLLDEAAIRRAAPDSEAMCKVAEALLRSRFGSQTRGTDSWMHLAASWHGSDEDKLALLKKVLPTVGLTPAQKPISSELPASFYTDLASLSIGELARRFEIERS